MRTVTDVVAVAAGLGIVAVVVGGTYVLSAHGGLEYRCIVDGPYPAFTRVSDDLSGLAGRFALWPLGRECVWPSAAGDGAVIAHGDAWGPTVMAGAGLVLVLFGVVDAIVARVTTRRR